MPPAEIKGHFILSATNLVCLCRRHFGHPFEDGKPTDTVGRECHPIDALSERIVLIHFMAHIARRRTGVGLARAFAHTIGI